MRSGFLTLRPGLRAKILLVSAFMPAALAASVLLTVHRDVRAHVDSTSIHENLEHSATVFESMLAVRLRALVGGAQVIASDPRFFSLVMLGPTQRDPHFVATMKGTADDFNRIVQTDLFEVYDRRGRRLASVGPRSTVPAGRASILRDALAGKDVARVVVEGQDHFQVAAVPVRADRQIVGVLLLGAQIGKPLAEELKSEMLSEVTFISNGRITGSTLTQPVDLDALRSVLGSEADVQPSELKHQGVTKLHAGSQTWLTLVRPLPDAEPGTSQLYVMQRSHDPESAFLARMQTDMSRLGILAIVVALVAGWMFARQITRPVMALVRGARAMERGEFDTAIDVKNRDELGYLAERFRVMRDRERAYVQSLQEAARVKSEFISVASHELRTPISVITGYRDLLSDGSLGTVSPHQMQALNAIRDSVGQLARLAEQATHMAQLEGDRVTLEPSEIEIGAVVARAIALAQSNATDRKVRVTHLLPADLGSAWADLGRLTETLTHLVANGIRFTPDGGEVRVTGHGDDAWVVLQVRDTGVGIPAARLQQIFDRSLMMRDSRHHHSSGSLEFQSKGLGFGLAIARAIVEAHGGTIDAASTEGEGTTITLRLPRRGVETLAA